MRSTVAGLRPGDNVGHGGLDLAKPRFDDASTTMNAAAVSAALPC